MHENEEADRQTKSAMILTKTLIITPKFHYYTYNKTIMKCAHNTWQYHWSKQTIKSNHVK